MTKERATLKPTSDLGHRRIRAWTQLVTGLLLAGASEILLFQGIEPFASEFYLIIWWAYILTIDATIYLVQGNSLIINRTGEFLVMLPWSVTVWLIFEMVNLRLDNWYYAHITPNPWIRWPGYLLAYATVLPGIFETAELLGCLGLFARTRMRPRLIASARFPVFYALGILFLILPLMFPWYFFPLIWLAFIFLLEPANYVHGAPSLLRDWEQGRPRTVLLLLAAGLICGGLWEFWNFWARSKWIYTVPFFDELKLFEMPVAGFLGFPPFAVECYVMYNFVSLFRYNRNWMMDSSGRASDRLLSRKLLTGTAAVMLSFFVFAFQAVDRYTINSFVTPLEKIPFIPSAAALSLKNNGIATVPEFLDHCGNQTDCERMRLQLSLSPRHFEEMVAGLRLMKLKWMGVDNVLLLRSMEIFSMEALARQDPDILYDMVTLHADKGERLPSRAKLMLWIRAARSE